MGGALNAQEERKATTKGKERTAKTLYASRTALEGPSACQTPSSEGPACSADYHSNVWGKGEEEKAEGEKAFRGAELGRGENSGEIHIGRL